MVAGNVETSQRVVDVLLGALGLAAASQGTMNNFTFGTERFGYYETIAGGAGATARRGRRLGRAHAHDQHAHHRSRGARAPLSGAPAAFAVRRGSGGAGAQRGGDGVVRELEALAPMTVSFLSERRVRAPFGLAGGQPGALRPQLRQWSSACLDALSSTLAAAIACASRRPAAAGLGARRSAYFRPARAPGPPV